MAPRPWLIVVSGPRGAGKMFHGCARVLAASKPTLVEDNVVAQLAKRVNSMIGEDPLRV